MGGDIVYICSKNAVFAGPNNVAYGAAKADQAHQVRLLAAELGEHGIRVNGINPDGVVRGSGIFAGGWGAQRAAVYGVPEEELGAFYAQRTLLKREVLPEHVAAAVFALTAGDLSLTTGLHIPVDAGVAARVPALTGLPEEEVRVMEAARRAVAAVDLGASGGRVMLGVIRGRDRLELRELHRFPNVPVRVLGTLHWDILSLYRGALDGIRRRGRGRRRGQRRDRFLGRRLRPARRGRGAAREPGALPGRPDRRDARPGAGQGPGGRALRDHRHPAAAVQHDLPARGGGGRPPSWRRPDPADDPGPAVATG